MIDINGVLKIINLARTNAAQDLAISNELLDIVNNLVTQLEKEKLNNENFKEISENLVNIAIKLTEQSKEVSVSVAKLAGLV